MRTPPRRLLLVALLTSSCVATQDVPAPPACPELSVLDGESFAGLVARTPDPGRLCLRYHRARAEVSWALAPAEEVTRFSITRTALELHEGDRLIGAWYGPCAKEAALRDEVSPEATHYMVRYLTLRRPAAVEVHVGAGIASIDLMFALETMREFGHKVYLNPRPLTEVPACSAQRVRDLSPPAPPSMALQDTIDPNLLDAIVSPRVPILQSCFRRTLRPMPCSSLVRRIDLDIDAQGMISDATVAEHTFGTPSVDACVGAAIWDMVFPPPTESQPKKATLRFQNCEQTPGASPSLDFSP